MTVSVCVVAYNEEKALPQLLECIKKQTFPHERMEVCLIDGISADRTKAIMEEFAGEDNGFYNVQVLDNPKRKQACGWNVAIANYKSDVIIRVDAHATIPEDFVEKNMKIQESGEYVCGGVRPNMIDEVTPWKELLLLAEQSMFGSSIASYRRSEETSYVKSLFHGCYRREVFEKAGGFNEQLGRTEDNEVHYRIRQAGYKILYSPDIVSYQHTRSSLKGMMKQKYGNGLWVALTLKACPKCLEIYHFVPLAFVLAIIFTTVLACMGYPLLGELMWGAYWLLAILMAVLSVRGQKKHINQILLPVLFFLLHISYGIGSLVGIIKLPFWKYEDNAGIK